VRFRINSNYVKKLDKPELARGWGACFSFSKSNILHDAPYDPYTPYLFFGEEMDVWARMYTNGWYLYAPTEPICFTSFDRSYRPTFWENPDQVHGEYLSRLRLYYRFGYLKNIPEELKIALEYYDLGPEKTWDEFMKFSLDDIEPTPPPTTNITKPPQTNQNIINPQYLNITEKKSNKKFNIEDAYIK
jgi:hypothetical protein